jgi:hypothetical protein
MGPCAPGYIPGAVPREQQKSLVGPSKSVARQRQSADFFGSLPIPS